MFRVRLAPTLAILLTSFSRVPIFVSGSLVFKTALVSLPVYTTTPTADPAARTVLAHMTFSTVRGMDVSVCRPGSVERSVRTPWNVWMSLIGGSADDQPTAPNKQLTKQAALNATHSLVTQSLRLANGNFELPISLSVQLICADEAGSLLFTCRQEYHIGRHPLILL